MEKQRAKGRKSSERGLGQGPHCIWGVMRKQPATLRSYARGPGGVRCGLVWFAWDALSLESITILGIIKKIVWHFVCVYLSIHLSISLIDSFLPYPPGFPPPCQNVPSVVSIVSASSLIPQNSLLEPLLFPSPSGGSLVFSVF